MSFHLSSSRSHDNCPLQLPPGFGVCFSSCEFVSKRISGCCHTRRRSAPLFIFMNSLVSWVRCGDTTIPEEKGSDDEFEPPAALKGGKKKASPAAKPAAAAPRKRGPAKKQTLITDTLKPAENIGISPEKKVRRIRQSPFNKKSSSVMGRVGEGSSSEMMMKSLTISEEQLNVVAAPVRRPVRASCNVTKYVLILLIMCCV
ncbi:hypothetical protein MKW98_009297 [Papaver atlanticum]|uniref:Uncharacterized protein n=1 Tax=Papaver atlanticum TaxID=357466 RepID=A0AAD4SEM9_9MAGN|nr:hypothetical protein MKW98_009297 [Papaver atlanticum]